MFSRFTRMSSLIATQGMAHVSRSGSSAIEALEARQLLSTIAWDGGANGNGANMLDPLNWAGDVLPAPGDDVTLGATGTSPGLTLAGTMAIRNLTSSRAFQVNAGGNLNVSGTADQSAALTLNLGTLTGGVWNMGSQVVNLTGNGTSFLAHADVRGTVQMAANTGINLSPGTRFTLLRVTNAAVCTIQLAASYVLQDAIVSDISTTLHLGQPAEIPLTIAPSGSLSVSGNFDIGNMSLTNNGTITAIGQGYPQFNTDVVNNGVISVASGMFSNAPFQNFGTMNLAGSRGADFQGTSFRNPGDINLQSELRIRSNITTADLHIEGIHNTGGSIRLSGVVNNANASFHVIPQVGVIFLSSGTLQGGTLDCEPGTRLGFGSGDNGASTLRDVQVTSPLLLDASTSIKITGAVTFPSMRMVNGTITLDGFVLNAPVTVSGTGANSFLLLNDNATASIGDLAVVRLDTGATNDLIIRSNNAGVPGVMRGVLEQAAAGRTLSLLGNWINYGEIRALTGNLRLDNNGNFATSTNQGTVRALGGSTVTFAAHDWFSPGVITADSSNIVFGGTGHMQGFNFAGFATVNSTVSVTGTLDNIDSIFTVTAATNTWSYTSGVISGGVMNTTNALPMTIPQSSTVTLRNIQINTEVQANGRPTLEGSTRFSRLSILATGGLTLGVGYTLRDEVVITGPGTFSRSVGFSASSSMGSSAVVRVDASATGSISIGGGINHGLIENNSAVTLQILNGTLVNYGTIRANTGSRILISSGTTVLNPGQIDIQGGTVEIDGTVQGSEFNGPGVTNADGVFAFGGTLNNAGNVLDLSHAGSLTLIAGATVNGGTIAAAPAGVVGVSTGTGSATANGVIFQGDVYVNDGRLNVTGATRFTSMHLRGAVTVNLPVNYTLRDIVVAEGAVVGIRNLVFASTSGGTIAQGATVELAADTAGDFVISGGFNAAAPLVNAGTIRAASAATRIRIQGPAFNNPGVLQVDGGSLSIESTVWNSSGQLNAINGVVSLVGTWSSAGSISLNNSTTTLGGSFTTTGLHLSAFSRTGGTLVVAGAWTNTGQNLLLDSALGSIILSGGSVTGGSIAPSSSSTLTVVGNGDISSVQVSGNILVLNTGALTVRGSTRFDTVYLRGLASMTFENNYTLRDHVVADGSAVGSRSVLIASSGTLTVGATGTIVHAADCGGDLLIRTAVQPSTLINDGSISTDAALRALTITTTTFTNAGALTLNAGRLAFTTGTMTTTGQISVNGGTLSLGGTFDTTGFDPTHMTRIGGTVELAGTLANTGRTFTLNAHTGSWNLVAATISSGDIVLEDGVMLNAMSGTIVFQTPVINGEIAAFGTTVLSIQGGTRFVTLHLRGAVAVDLLSSFTLFDAIIADGPETGTRTIRMQGATSCAIAPTGSIRIAANSGGDLSYAPVVNASLNNVGLISSESATRVLTLRVTNLTNTGTIQAAGGNVQITGSVSNVSSGVLNGGTWRASAGGTISGLPAITRNSATIVLDGSALAAISGLQNNSGTLTLSSATVVSVTPATGTFTQAGTLSLDAGSHLQVTGAFVQTAAGQLLITVGGTDPALIGQVIATGSAALDGTLTVTFAPGYAPHKLDGFDVVVGSSVSGTFSTLNLPPPLPVGRNFMLYDGDSARFVVSSLADTNSDGIVDFFDYLDFVAAFSINDPVGDFNGDGTIDFFDYLDFVAEFSQF